MLCPPLFGFRKQSDNINLSWRSQIFTMLLAREIMGRLMDVGMDGWIDRPPIRSKAVSQQSS